MANDQGAIKGGPGDLGQIGGRQVETVGQRNARRSGNVLWGNAQKGIFTIRKKYKQKIIPFFDTEKNRPRMFLDSKKRQSYKNYFHSERI